MKSIIPSSWILVNLEELVISRKGKRPTILSSERKDGYIPYILVNEMEGKPVRSYTNDQKVPIASERDILVVWDGSIGKTASGLKGAIGSTIVVLTPIIIETNYLESFLKLSKPYIEQTSRGSGLQHVNPDSFWKLQIPLAPLNEQRRIVTKLEKLLHKVDACKERLDKIPNILRRFRQSVLYAACSGRLTADWRQKHCNDERAFQLLSRIPKEKRKNWEKGEYDRIQSNGGLPDNDKWQVKYKYDPEPNAEALYKLPQGWAWATVDQVCSIIIDCPHSTPKWTDRGEICIRTTNFYPGSLDLSNVRYVSPETYRERTRRLEPRPGDVIYSREGGILGVACIIPQGAKVCLGQRIMLMRTDNSSYLSTFLMNVLNSPPTLELVRELTGGTASPHLNVGDINKFPIPVPPVSEQAEIVRRVTALFKIANQIEERYGKAKDYLGRLTQSILAKAFRGELVAQDPNDEPASVLLARIREEHKKTAS